jgi:hypothetical protein
LLYCCAQERRGAAGLRAAVVEQGFSSTTQFVEEMAAAYKVWIDKVQAEAQADAARRRALEQERLNAGQSVGSRLANTPNRVVFHTQPEKPLSCCITAAGGRPFPLHWPAAAATPGTQSRASQRSQSMQKQVWVCLL